MIETNEVSDSRILNEINYFIMNNEELSNRLLKLKEMNNDIKTDIPLENNPIICTILFFILAALVPPLLLFDKIFSEFNGSIVWFLLILITYIPALMLGFFWSIILNIFFNLNCF
jgi:hypothetical protein